MTARTKTIVCVTGTRAEWGLMRSTVLRLQQSPSVDLKILVTGMHTQRRFGHTLAEVEKAVRVDYVVPIGERDDQLTALGKEIDGIGRFLSGHPADALLVVGDRDEPFAAALAALHRGIPVIHVAGGDVTGPTVDHFLRNAITLFSRVHLVQSKRSAENVKELGADPRWTSIVGAPGLDGLRRSALASRKDLSATYGLDPGKRWFLVVMHPAILDEVPVAAQIRPVLEALSRLDSHDEKIILYPNADDGNEAYIAAIEKLRGEPHVHLERHLPREDYLGLMKESAALIGNTSSGLMEGGYLKVPFVHVGNRQKGREHGPNVLFVRYDAGAIMAGVTKALSPRFRTLLTRSSSAYRGGDVAGRIVSAIERFLNTL